MPGRSHRAANDTTSATTGASAGASSAGLAPLDNNLLKDLLSGSVQLDGRAEDWFARGVVFQRGMKGPIVEALQIAIGAGVDGDFGPGTEAAIENFQRDNSDVLQVTGIVDAHTWEVIQDRGGTLATLSGEDDFARMWAAHPHNYLEDESQNTSSEAIRQEFGLAEWQSSNTCAIRMSMMLNRLGGGHALTTNKAKEAGLHKMRRSGLLMPEVDDTKTAKEEDRLILSAREMWTYIEEHRGAPDVVWPPQGRAASEEEAQEIAEQVKASVAGKKGFVAFDKIFGYGGTGHIDLFDGEQLSDGSWYPAERILIWYVVNPEAEAARNASN